jgi:cell division protein FtsQ
MSAFTMRSSTKAPRVEPRFQARRAEVARHQGRKRLRNLLLVLIAIMAAACLYQLTRTPLLDVDHIRVRGTSDAQAAEVRAALGFGSGTPMVSADPGAAEARLEALAWVKGASVARSWPSTIEVTVTERRPVAIMGTGSSAVLVDADGRTLRPATGQDLPELGGPPADLGEQVPPLRREVADVLGRLPAALSRQVASAHASKDGIMLTLDDGITVRWGDTSQPTAKVDALLALLEQADRATIDRIDITVPRASTVTRTGSEP